MLLLLVLIGRALVQIQLVLLVGCVVLLGLSLRLPRVQHLLPLLLLSNRLEPVLLLLYLVIVRIRVRYLLLLLLHRGVVLLLLLDLGDVGVDVLLLRLLLTEHRALMVQAARARRRGPPPSTPTTDP